jgi:predicted tellurium resistance membrane protein TerC
MAFLPASLPTTPQVLDDHGGCWRQLTLETWVFFISERPESPQLPVIREKYLPMPSHLTFPDFSDPSIWASLVTLFLLETVLGIDNIIFISLLTNKLDDKTRPRARRIGLLLALVMRIGLLFGITWIITLKEPVFHIPFWPDATGQPMGVSVKELILIAGGLFLLTKSTSELYYKTEGVEKEHKSRTANAFVSVIFQIVLIDIVFSFDSILTAVGLVESVWIMIIAVILSMMVMLMAAGKIGDFINSNPSLQVLALSFLIMIGVLLIAEGFEQSFGKGYVYFGMAFSLGVEILNMRMRKRLNKPTHKE